MNYKLRKTEAKKNVMELEVTLTAEEWRTEVQESYNRNKGKYNVEGFRKGKAPRKVIENMYGPNVFYDDALTEGFSKAYGKALEEHKDFEPIDAPSLDVKSLDEKGVVIVAEIPVMPEIKMGAYTGLKINVEPKKVSDKDVKAELERVRTQHARLVEKQGAIENGNIANIDFKGLKDGVAFDGGTAQGYDLEIGSHTFIEGFEEQLIGAKVGDQVTVNVKFPENYQAEELKGQPAVFEVKINSVKVKELPELNDAFASDISEFETMEEYKKHVKEHLEEHAREHAKIDTENKIIEKIISNMEVEVPAQLVDHELEHIMQDLEYRLMYQGLRLEDYAKYMNTTVEQIAKDRRKEAEKGVKIRLAMQEIIKAEKLDVTKSEVDEKIKELAKNSKKTIKEYKETLTEERINYLKNDILMNKLLTFLIEANK